MIFSFLEVCADVTKTATKVPQSEYLNEGKYPIFDQGKEYVGGYCNNPNGLASQYPYIVFGDHTRIMKYVETSCYIGADGVKLLKVINNNFAPKYVYYSLIANPVENLGYSRHYRLLKETKINYVDINEQVKIINELDQLYDLIGSKRKQLSSLDELIKSRFIDMFEDKGFEEVILGDVIKTTSGGTPKSTNKAYYEGGSIPWLTSGEVNQEIIHGPKNFITQLGLDNSSAKLVPENCVVIAMYGATAGKVGLVKYKTTTNQAVCVLLPSKDFLPEYLMQACSNKEDWMISKTIGSGQPNISQLIIKRMPLIRAPINLQKEYVNFVNLIDKSKFINFYFY